MSRLRAFARGASITGLATIAIGGTAYAAERVLAGRIRRNDRDGVVDVLEPIAHGARAIASHDGGTISLVDVAAIGSCVRAPIVLSHGVTLSVRTWVQQIDAFANAGHRTIAFDHRGHGGSKLGTNGFGVEQLGRDIADVLEHLDVCGAIVVGHSMGGIGVQSFVAQFPEIAQRRVAGIVLLSTLPSALSGSQAARLGHAVERITRRTPDSTRLWANPHLGLVVARFGFGKDPNARDVELVRQMMHECDRVTRVEGPRSLIGFDLVEELARIDIPTLIIGGSADVITPPRDSQRMHDRIPQSRLVVLDGGGHMLMLERATEVNRLILQFAGEVGTEPGPTG